MDKLIVTVALIGGTTTRDKSPYPPMTPAELATSAIEACRAGASIAHIHVRDPETFEASMRLEHYAEVCRRIRGECDLVLNLTMGPGARLTHDAHRGTWNTSGLKTAEERAAHVLELRPEICSLDAGSFNLGRVTFVNILAVIERLAKLVRDAGVKPELEVFDLGHLGIARHLCATGLVVGRPLVQLCLGFAWGIDASVESLLAMRRGLPAGAHWTAFAPSAQHYPMAALSLLHGGHVRVGFEDNLYLRRGVLARTNAELVTKVVELAGFFDREVATPAEARQLLELPPPA